MTEIEIVKRYLFKHGYDGLCCDGSCDFHISELKPRLV